MNTRHFASFVAVALVTAICLPASAAETPAEPGAPVFDLTPALDAAMQRAMMESILQSEPSSSDHQERAISLLMPAGSQDKPGFETFNPSTANRRPGDWLVGDFNTTSKWVTGGLVLGLGAMLGFADEEDVRDLGDITQLIPAVTALGFSAGTRDWEGVKQYVLAGGTALVATHGIKNIVEKTRPDDSANNSFPSGHTSASVTGAAFIWRRYGPRWGAPASVLAAYTGLSRVAGQKHFMDDVISGTAIGLISNWLWTDPVDDRVKMALFPTKGGVGLNVEVDPTAPRPSGVDLTEYDTIPTRVFFWEIGFADVNRNNVRAPADSETIDWRFDQENNPTTTALIYLGWATPNRKHNLFLTFAPFEVREVLTFDEDVDYSTRLFEAGTEVQSRYLAYDYRAGYVYSVVTTPRFGLNLGGAIAVLDTYLTLTAEEQFASEGAVEIRPQIGVDIDWVMARRWLLFANYFWWSDSTVEIKDGTVQVAYRLHTKWGLSLGYRRVDRQINTTDLYNDADRNQVALGVWYMW